MSSIDLSKVTIAIPTFLRPGYLGACVASILKNLPECKIAIACDDKLTPEPWPNDKFKFVRLPFDTGLTAKRNHAVQMSETEYTLIACDDFDFSNLSTRRGIERMVHVLDTHKEIDVAVGTYNDKKYEGTLLYVPGEYIAERRTRWDLVATLGDSDWNRADGEWRNPSAYKIDIGINYFLARTKVLREVPWDETIRPIGGEHADWFMMMKDYRKTIAWVPNCPIWAFERNDFWMSLEYRSYRRRAYLGHEAFLSKWNIRQYVGFDEPLPGLK